MEGGFVVDLRMEGKQRAKDGRKECSISKYIKIEDRSNPM